MRANQVWIVTEPNDKLDASKLSRAFLRLALHQAANEAEAEQDHTTRSTDGDGDESA